MSLMELDQGIVQATKRAVWQGSEMGLEAGLDLEARLALAAAVVPEGGYTG